MVSIQFVYSQDKLHLQLCKSMNNQQIPHIARFYNTDLYKCYIVNNDCCTSWAFQHANKKYSTFFHRHNEHIYIIQSFATREIKVAAPGGLFEYVQWKPALVFYFRTAQVAAARKDNIWCQLPVNCCLLYNSNYLYIAWKIDFKNVQKTFWANIKQASEDKGHPLISFQVLIGLVNS